MAKYSPSQNRATQKYVKNNYDSVTFRLRKDGELSKEALQQAAELAGESVNEYIVRAVSARIRREADIRGSSLL